MNRRLFSKGALAATLGGFGTTGCSGKKSSEEAFQWSSLAFDTPILVQYLLPETVDQGQLHQRLSERTFLIEKQFSLYIEDSLLSVLNRDGRLEHPSDEFIEVVKRAVKYGKLTSGIFDVSVQPLWLWYSGESHLSSLEQVLSLVDYRKISLSDGGISLQKGMKLTLNGCIQGYLADQLADVLRDFGVRQGLVDGGEFRMLGEPCPQWQTLGIRGRANTLLDSIKILAGHALAVSAGYGHLFKATQQSHLFHPKNRMEVSPNRTFAVVASEAFVADIYATVMAVQARSEWKEISQKVSAVRVYEGKKLIFASG